MTSTETTGSAQEAPNGKVTSSLGRREVVLATAALAAGTWIATGSWATYVGFGANRAVLYPPPGVHPEIVFWYSLPGFEAGLLVGLLAALATKGVRWLVLALNVAVWAQVLFFLFILGYLFQRGAMF